MSLQLFIISLAISSVVRPLRGHLETLLCSSQIFIVGTEFAFLCLLVEIITQ